MNTSGGKVSEAVQGVGGGLVRRLQQAVAGNTPAPADAEPRSRWRSVTINRGREEVMPGGQLPGPLAALGDLVEVQVRPAPGGRTDRSASGAGLEQR